MLSRDEDVRFDCQSGLAKALFVSGPERPEPVLAYTRTVRRGESVFFSSAGDEVAGTLFLPDNSTTPAPALVICHGAGDWKENYFELCDSLAGFGVASLAIDMHGHGETGGERFCVEMPLWVADVRAAVDFLCKHPRVNPDGIAAFGLSSGGTAILEAALIDPRLKALIALDATVRNSLPFQDSIVLKGLLALGRMKMRLTKTTLRLPLAKLSTPKVASEPEINRQFLANPSSVEAFMSFPLPGGEQAFFVDTIKRVGGIATPTLVLWGADDKVDPPRTAWMLFEALNCKKRLEIIPGNGHVGHLDRNRDRVFELTRDWVMQNIANRSAAVETVQSHNRPVSTSAKIIEGEAARNLGRREKWELLSPFLKQHGQEALAYATLQEGMEYFIDEHGYVAYTTVQHPVFARKPKRIALSDPVCAPEHVPNLIRNFLKHDRRAVFGVISERCAGLLRPLGFKVNCIGYEPELPIQTYNTNGNWKELDLIKRARNEVKREGITIREEKGDTLNRDELSAISAKWIGQKKINDREIWIYARRPVFEHEEDVRKFVAYDREGRVVGFVFYDPMYRAGRVFGYAAQIVRCDEQRFGRLATAVHMTAIETFKPEGREVLNLLLAPFVKLDQGKFNDDRGAEWFLRLSARFGNDIYNFKGLSFHKSKYRGAEKPLYYASNSLFPGNDLYLAFLSADVTRSYFSTMGQLLRGMFTAGKNRGPE